MAVWIKPSGKEIDVNENPVTVEYVVSLGYTRKQEPKKKQVKKRGAVNGDSSASS